MQESVQNQTFNLRETKNPTWGSSYSSALCTVVLFLHLSEAQMILNVPGISARSPAGLLMASARPRLPRSGQHSLDSQVPPLVSTCSSSFLLLQLSALDPADTGLPAGSLHG